MPPGGQPSQDAIPRFARGVRLSRDEVRERWVLLAPERILEPDDVALEILQRIDGRSTLAEISSRLAEEFSADQAEISADVAGFISEMSEKGMIEL